MRRIMITQAEQRNISRKLRILNYAKESGNISKLPLFWYLQSV
jgi:hypothetical protein